MSTSITRCVASVTLAALGVSALVALRADDAKAAPPAGAETKEKAKEKALPTGKNGEMAVIETNLGTIKVRFFADVAPKAVENFLGLASQGKYDGVIFHRVIDGFMIQGGDPTGTGAGGKSIWGKTFEDEFSPKHRFEKKGILAMANAGPKTNGSQFFITLGQTAHLNNKHTIFGEVAEGMDVVEKIAKVKKGPRDKPLEDVVMKKVTVVEAKAPAAPAAPAAPSEPKKG